MSEWNLGLREYAVSRAIIELRETHEYINAEMIADHIRCSTRTVYSALTVLQSAKQVRRGQCANLHGGKGGYAYEYIGDR